MKLKTIIAVAVILTAVLLTIIISCTSIQRTIVPLQMIQGAEFVGTETCAFCHEEIVNDFIHTDHGRMQMMAEDERAERHGCESCHGAGSLHMEAGGGRGVYIINPKTNPSPCYQCHADIKAYFNLQYHHPVNEKRMNCIHCHDPHGRDIFNPKGIFVARENETCASCHREQARPRVFEHEALREGCASCHEVHGSINDKMLTVRDNNLCLKCHAQIASPGVVVIGDFSHTTRVMQGTCWSASCHTAVHGSDINPHLRY